MGKRTEISWAHSTFNPWIGCTRVSPGCQNCYAERYGNRFGVEWGPGQTRRRTSPANWKQPLAWNRAAAKSGEPHRVFCASLADWLDHEIPTDWLADLLALIAETPHLTWMLLTKRPESWRQRVTGAWVNLSNRGHPARWVGPWLDGELPWNVWIGTTVEDQHRADQRVPELLKIPARVRFLSCEPLLGPVDVRPWLVDQAEAFRVGLRNGSPTHAAHPWSCQCGCWDPQDRVGWVIAGGESGPGARPMHPEWARGLRDQCQEAGVAFFLKQWGEWVPEGHPSFVDWHGADDDDPRWCTIEATPDRMTTHTPGYRAGKAAAGRELDGRTWDEVPA